MIISAQQVNRVLKLNQAHASYSKKKVDSGATTAKTDKIELSGQAKELQFAKDLALKSADIRVDKVNELKKQIEEGTYKPSGSEIASKMIERSLGDLFAER